MMHTLHETRDSNGRTIIRLNQDGGEVPRLSVVIPTYNRGQVLKEAVVSLQMQNEKRFEIIVVDNGPSTDNTEAVMRALAAGDPRIIYVITTEQGDFISRNIGCRMARADIILSIDDDWEMLDPDTLGYMIERFAGDPSLGVLGLGHREVELERGVSGLRRWWYRIARYTYAAGKISRWGRVSTRMYYLPYGMEHRVDHVKGACQAFRTDIARRVGFFPTFYTIKGLGYRSETELCRRFVRAGYYIEYSTRYTGLHKATPRPQGLQERARTIAAVRQWSRNNMLFTARNYWSPATAWLFAVYDLCVGNRNQPGMLRVFGLTHWMQLSLLRSSMRGKLEGYRDYRRRYFDVSVTE